MGDHPAILRIALKNDKAEPFVDLSSMVRVPGDTSTWFTLTPDHAVLLLRYFNTWEIYSMHYSED
jgi:cupin superfamily acireductone dioxygenase involved in methionine salvage